MACRLNGDGKNFDKAAANLARTAQVQVSGETLRVLVETEGKRVLQAQQSGRLPRRLVGGGLPRSSRADDRADLFRQRRGDGAAGDRRREGRPGGRRSRRSGAGAAGRPGRCRRGRPARTSSTRSSRSSPIYDETQEHRLVRGHAGRPRGRRAADAAGGGPHPPGPGRREGGQRRWLALDPQPGRAAEPAFGRLGPGLLPPQRERPQGAAGDLRRRGRGGQGVGRRRCCTPSSTTVTKRPGSGCRPGDSAYAGAGGTPRAVVGEAQLAVQQQLAVILDGVAGQRRLRSAHGSLRE